MIGDHPDRKLFDLGLAISGATLKSGEFRTLRELSYFISAAVGYTVSWQAISNIEQRALRKLRIKYLYHKDPILRDAVREVFHR